MIVHKTQTHSLQIFAIRCFGATLLSVLFSFMVIEIVKLDKTQNPFIEYIFGQMVGHVFAVGWSVKTSLGILIYFLITSVGQPDETHNLIYHTALWFYYW